MSSVSAPRFHVLSAAQIAARRSPFLSDSFIYNYTTKELRFGPGPWSSCRVLLQAGEGSAENELTADQLAAVVGANAPNASNVFATMIDVPETADEIGVVVPYFRATIDGAEHTYVWTGIANGKPYYTQVGADTPLNEMFFWYEESEGVGYWSLLVIGNPVAQETPNGNTLLPGLVASWTGSAIPVFGDVVNNVDEALRTMPTVSLNGFKQDALLVFTGVTDGSGRYSVDLTALPKPVSSAQFFTGSSSNEAPCSVVVTATDLSEFTVRAFDKDDQPVTSQPIVFSLVVKHV